MRLWSSLKSEGDVKYKEYQQFEGDIKTTIKEVKEILEELKSKGDYAFYLMNYSIPVNVCSTLLKDHFADLTEEERKFCKDVTLEFIESSLHTNFKYPITNGFSSALQSLPILYGHFPKDRKQIKEYLLFTLFDDTPINMAGTRVCDYAVSVIVNQFWKVAEDDTEAILWGYLLLKDDFSKLRHEHYQSELFKKSTPYQGGYILTRENIEVDFKKLKKQFIKENKDIYEKLMSNGLKLEDLGDISKVEIETLITSFYLFQNDTNEATHFKYITGIVPLLVNKIFIEDDNGPDYLAKTRFLDKFAHFVLSRKPEEIEELIKPFLSTFKERVDLSDLFESLINAQDRLQANENFWLIWNQFKPQLVEVYKKNKNSRYFEKTIKSFLFSNTYWKEDAKKWDTLKNENKEFFKSIASDLKTSTAALYSISKLLNGVGSNYIDDGITWLSDMIKDNEEISKAHIDDNTLYYLENLLRKFAFENKQKIRENKDLKDKVLILLDFIIAKGSSVGYMLREYIL